MVETTLFAKQKWRTNLWTPRGKWGEMKWETGVDIHTLLILRIKQRAKGS